MNDSMTRSDLGLAMIAGSVWGLSEVALGVGLRACAHLISGSMMTGVALFFMAFVWAKTRNYLMPVLVVLVASCFKLFDAVLLSLPVMHGAIENPIFAFLLEGSAFVLLIVLFKNVQWNKVSSRALLGGGSALIAVALFPLVKFATGIPACLFPNSMIPLSIYFSPLAIVFSSLTVPLGFYAGEKIGKTYDQFNMKIRNGFVRFIISPGTLIVCLLLVVLFRWLVV